MRQGCIISLGPASPRAGPVLPAPRPARQPPRQPPSRRQAVANSCNPNGESLLQLQDITGRGAGGGGGGAGAGGDGFLRFPLAVPALGLAAGQSTISWFFARWVSHCTAPPTPHPPPPHTQHGLSSNKMALVTSECDAMRTHGASNGPNHLGMCACMVLCTPGQPEHLPALTATPATVLPVNPGAPAALC